VQNITVRRGTGRGLGGDDPAGAGPVVDDELLAELLGELVGDDPRGHVGDSASPVRDDDAHRAVRIAGLRRGRQQRERGRRGREQSRRADPHAVEEGR
jgi:hypothetical protein